MSKLCGIYHDPRFTADQHCTVFQKARQVEVDAGFGRKIRTDLQSRAVRKGREVIGPSQEHELAFGLVRFVVVGFIVKHAGGVNGYAGDAVVGRGIKGVRLMERTLL
jgi:hypothetical protein